MDRPVSSDHSIRLLLIFVFAFVGAALAWVGLSESGLSAATPTKVEFDEITARRINVVDADGTPRFVLSNGSNMPPAMMRGQRYSRSITNAAGMTFFQADGDETGGIASSKQPNGALQTALIIDYTHQPTDGVSIGKQESANGKRYLAGMFIADRRPHRPGPVTGGTEGVERIALTNDTGNASLVISGTDGKPRIRIGVDENNNARIEMLDATGRVIREL